MEEISSTETLFDFHRDTRLYSPEYKSLHNRRCENLKPYLFHNLLHMCLRLAQSVERQDD
jgi:hypothetical protein